MEYRRDFDPAPPCRRPCRFLLDFLAERKSYSDLSSSIIDGRYTAQKWVMAGQDAAQTCFYILEGNAADLNGFGQGMWGSVCKHRAHSMHVFVWGFGGGCSRGESGPQAWQGCSMSGAAWERFVVLAAPSLACILSVHRK